MRDESLIRTRQKLQEAMERAEADYRRQLLIKRIELAQSGMRAFQAGKLVDATRNFHTYIRILEDWKGCPEGGLTPSHFNSKKDVAELLLISGVYWDLVKLYDRTKTPEKRKEFLHYLEKFILFSRGMPFQTICAETLRRYISIEKPRHKDDFKNAYKMIAVSKCFVVTALCDVTNCKTLPRLRRFRDDTLSRSKAGRAFIRWYYRYGPFLARCTEGVPETGRRALGVTLDQLAEILESLTSKRSRFD